MKGYRNIGLLDNPRAKQSSKYRAMLKRQQAEALRRQRDDHSRKAVAKWTNY